MIGPAASASTLRMASRTFVLCSTGSFTPLSLRASTSTSHVVRPLAAFKHATARRYASQSNSSPPSSSRPGGRRAAAAAAAAGAALLLAATFAQSIGRPTVVYAEELENGGGSVRRKYKDYQSLEVIASLPQASSANPSKIDPGPIASVPFSSLARSYLVYTLCSIPAIVDHSPRLLDVLTHSPIPGVPTLTYSLVRQTFFKQFVGGESVTDCHETMRDLRRRGCGTLLAYSVEVDEHEAEEHKERPVSGDAKRRAAESHVQETLRAIEDAGAFERSVKDGASVGATWVAVKVTGLTPDPEALHRASNELVRRRYLEGGKDATTRVRYPGTPTTGDLVLLQGSRLEAVRPVAVAAGGVLDGEEGLRRGDVETLRDLAGVLREIASKAQDNGVRIVIDAEHSWYQPALDACTLMLSQEFNKGANGTLVYGTYQAYLTRNPEHLASTLAHARAHGYSLGVKLVRGAYHEQERRRWRKEGRATFGPDPIWPDKTATDRAYDDGVEIILRTLVDDVKAEQPASVAVLFGTHNRHSCELIVGRLRQLGMLREDDGGIRWSSPALDGRVTIGQLFGMADELTDNVTHQLPPFATLKYVPYGRLEEVMPYLGRRATENKSLLKGEHGAAAERRRAWSEMARRAGLGA